MITQMNKSDFKKKLGKVFASLHLNYNNVDLYYAAFSHPSFGNENGTGINYERLEFLGDTILDFLVAEYLYLTKDMKEGEMTKIKSKYVCEQANADYSVETGINCLIMVGNGAHKSKEEENKSVLGNVFESFLAALYLDHDVNYVRDFLKIWVFPKLDNLKEDFFVDYKTMLQEAIQAERSNSPVYRIINETGPAHDKSFEALVMIDDIKLGRGIGKTKKDAEQNAAKAALDKLAKN